MDIKFLKYNVIIFLDCWLSTILMDLAHEGDRQYLGMCAETLIFNFILSSFKWLYIKLFMFSFVEKSGTNTLLKEAMIKLINNRPSDPISFLIDL